MRGQDVPSTQQSPSNGKGLKMRPMCRARTAVTALPKLISLMPPSLLTWAPVSTVAPPVDFLNISQWGPIKMKLGPCHSVAQNSPEAPG